jgi:hypothetical protein
MPRIAGHIRAPPIPISTRLPISQALGDAACQRHRREDRGADEEDPAAPEHVGEPAAGDQDHAEGERVGVDRPLDGADVGVEVLLDLRDRDVRSPERWRAEDRDPMAINAATPRSTPPLSYRRILSRRPPR